ncbi:hypothetical protein FOA24_34575 [Bacillus thuringiensis]|uniref:hypothetical protein n=1 Tax=Bacillus thuringiensis TaxID=1428 RepID=UPI00333B4F73
MIKNCMRKIVRQTVFGLIMAVSFSVVGGNSASAEEIELPRTVSEEIYDYDGNPIEFGAEYYIESDSTPNHAVAAAVWNNGYWGALGNRNIIKIKFKDRTPLIGERFGVPNINVLNRPLQVELETTTKLVDALDRKYPTSLGLGSDNSIELLEQGKPAVVPWNIYHRTVGGKYLTAFRHADKKTFLYHNGPGSWLYANQPSIDGNQNTLWRIVKL